MSKKSLRRERVREHDDGRGATGTREIHHVDGLAEVGFLFGITSTTSTSGVTFMTGEGRSLDRDRERMAYLADAAKHAVPAVGPA